MTYELFYSYGGHGGPYPTLASARRAARAKLKGDTSKTLLSVSIVERTTASISGYGRSVEKITREDMSVQKMEKV